LLIGVVVASWFFPPHVDVTAAHWAAVALALSGAALAIWASRTLGSSLTPFPKPKDDARLATDGPFALVRHPIYTGGILFFAGCSLRFSWWGLAATADLALLWAFKLRVEERYLAARFPQYEEYRQRVRSRLVPYVY
jgi:protein-S-isoprenylcysteine O-methyltransferase Ste14